MPEQYCDVGRGITLSFETFGDPVDPPALLVMGLGVQMVAWQEDFCSELAARGLHVVRFDNRDIGHSTHMRTRPPNIAQLARRSGGRAARERLHARRHGQDTAGLLDGAGARAGARHRRLDGRHDRPRSRRATR